MDSYFLQKEKMAKKRDNFKGYIQQFIASTM